MKTQSCHKSFWYTVALLLAISPVLFTGCGPKTMEVPESYARWNSKDGSFAIDYPEGWEAEGTGNKGTGLAYAEFSKGPIEIRLDVSLADSLKGEMAGGGMFGGAGSAGVKRPGDEEIASLSAPAVIQRSHLKHYKKEYPGYVEDEGELIQVPLGKTYVNVFAAKNGYRVVNGIRSTTLSRHRSVTFFAHCPEAHWETFQPVFWKMLEGMSLGVEETKF